MLPPITGAKNEVSSSTLRWQTSTRRISYVKLPSIPAIGNGKNKTPSVQSDDDAVTSDTSPSAKPLPIPSITPSLCIDNQYFANYISETPKMDNVDYLSRAFSSNIKQQNSKIGEALGCLAVCNQIAEKYQCSLEDSFQILIDDFSEKAFKLSSLTSQLHVLRQTHHANMQVRKNDESQLEEITWRIEREEKRIKKLDEKLSKLRGNENKNNME